MAEKPKYVFSSSLIASCPPPALGHFPPGPTTASIFAPPNPCQYHRCIMMDFEYFSQILYGFTPVIDKGVLPLCSYEVILR